jgi:hypothetical protein
LEYCKSKDELNDRERFWIEKLNTKNPDSGYNIHRGGQGRDTSNTRLMNDGVRCYYVHLEDVNNHIANGFVFGPLLSTIEKCRISSLGEKNPMYGKRGAEHPHYNYRHSSETKEIIKNKNLNRVVSDETKEKQSLSKLKDKNPMYGKKQASKYCNTCKKFVPVNIFGRFHKNH